MCKDKWPAAKRLLKLSLGLKRLVGAILEPSDQTRSPLSFGFGRRETNWASNEIARIRALPGLQRSSRLSFSGLLAVPAFLRPGLTHNSSCIQDSLWDAEKRRTVEGIKVDHVKPEQQHQEKNKRQNETKQQRARAATRPTARRQP